MADDGIVKFPQRAVRPRAPFDDERILEILDSAGMGVNGMRLVKAAFPKVTVEQVLAVLERARIRRGLFLWLRAAVSLLRVKGQQCPLWVISSRNH